MFLFFIFVECIILILLLELYEFFKFCSFGLRILRICYDIGRINFLVGRFIDSGKVLVLVFVCVYFRVYYGRG